MKRHAVTLVIALLAVLATAYLLVVDRGRPSDAERALREHRLFSSFRQDELTRIAVERPNDPFDLVRDDTREDAGDRTWRMFAPVRSPADQAAVGALIAILDGASPLRAATDDPAEFAEIRAHVILTMGRTSHVLDLGGPAPAPSGAAYVRVDKGNVVVLGPDLVGELLLPSDKFRLREIAPSLSDHLGRIAIDRGAQHVVFTRSGAASYRLADGERASRAAVDRVLLAISDLRAETFVPDAELDQEAPTFAPTLTITLGTSGGSPPPITLRFGGACAGHLDTTRVIRDATPTLSRLGACVATAALEAFDLDSSKLVERHVFQARADEVSELRLDAPGAVLEIARKGGGWHERSPQDRDLTVAETEAAAALLTRMLALEGEPHAAGGGAALAPDHVASLLYGEPTVEERFAFDARGRSPEMTIDPAAVHLLEPSVDSLRPLALWDPPLDRLRVDRIEARCEGHVQQIVATPNGWNLTTPVSLPADGASVLDLIDAVAREKADRWLASAEALGAADANVGACDAPTGVTLRLAARNGSAAETACVGLSKGPNDLGVLHVARSDKPASFARANDATFGPLRDRACASFVDRHRFVLSAAATAVSLRYADGTTRSIDGASLTSIDAGFSADAIATLDSLVADGVAHLGAPVAADRLAHPALTVTVSVGDSGAPQVLRFGAEIEDDHGRARRATVDGLAAVFTFDAAKLAPLFSSAPSAPAP